MNDAIHAVWCAVHRAFSDWDLEKLGRDIALNVVAAVVIAFIASRWDRIRWYLTRDRADFRRMLGPGAARSHEIVVVLGTFRDPRSLSVEAQKKLQEQLKIPASTGETSVFYKFFPDGHVTAFQVGEEPILSHEWARDAAYVTDSVAAVRGTVVRPVADEEIAARWNSTFVCIGSSYTNIRSDDVKLSSVNQWLADDGGKPKFVFKDGAEVGITQRQHLGYVLKVSNPFSPGHVCIVCGGIGANGTSGAAQYFAANWRGLSRRFRVNSFLIVLAITPGSDQAAQEIRIDVAARSGLACTQLHSARGGSAAVRLTSSPLLGSRGSPVHAAERYREPKPRETRRGNCGDNAVAESFFATLKVELVHGVTWATRAGACADLFDYLEIFYNAQRRHSSLGSLSPLAFERQWEQERAA